MRRWRWCSAVALVALVAGLAGCGSGRSSAGTSGDTAQIGSMLTVEGPSARTERTTGVYDFGAQRGRFQTTVEAASAATPPSGGRSSGEATIILGSTTYAPVPDLPGVPALKRWLVISAPRSTSASAAALQALAEPASSASTAPDRLLGVLRGGSTMVATVGHPEIDGVQVTEYRLSLKPLSSCAKLAIALQPVLLWVDAQGRVRRTQLELSFKLAPSTATTTETSTVNYTDFGVPVAVSAPPAAQVETPQELARDLHGSPGDVRSLNLFDQAGSTSGC